MGKEGLEKKRIFERDLTSAILAQFSYLLARVAYVAGIFLFVFFWCVFLFCGSLSKQQIQPREN